ncbi:MAG: DUF5053 domain-containing protein [Porphyromonadaceae bacterium]|nr:DUF5053 domain-containing protein [Porphyromonadaceae bacterium]
MAIQTKGDERPESTKAKVRDILVDVSWRSIAAGYFHKSVSWFYQRLNGIDGNGKPTDFTPEEREQLRGALCDLAERIRRAADNLAED